MAKVSFADEDTVTNAELIEDADTDTATSGSGGTDVVAMINSLNNPAEGFYNSLAGRGGDDGETALIVAEALTSSEPIKQHLKEPFNLANVIMTPVLMLNEKTGEYENVPRVILLTDDNVAYHGISQGLALSVQNIILALGQPSTWNRLPRLPRIQIIEEKSTNGLGYYFTVKFVKP